MTNSYKKRIRSIEIYIRALRICTPCAGSLLNLAKHPSSTVQILGAEKALFRSAFPHVRFPLIDFPSPLKWEGGWTRFSNTLPCIGDGVHEAWNLFVIAKQFELLVSSKV